MNGLKIVFLVCFIPSVGIVRSSVPLNEHGKTVQQLTDLQRQDMEAMLSDQELEDTEINLDSYLAMLGLGHHRHLFNVGMRYHVYKMLKDQLNYMLSEAIYFPIFDKASDKKEIQDNAAKKIEIIQKLLDYATLLEYQTKEQDFEQFEQEQSQIYDAEQSQIQDAERFEQEQSQIRVNATVLRAYAKRILEEIDEDLLQTIINREPGMKQYILDMMEYLDDDYKLSFEKYINEARDGLLFYIDNPEFNFNVPPEYLRALEEELLDEEQDDVLIEAQPE